MILPLDSDLLPVVNRELWLRINKDESWQKDERARCSEEPWYWLSNFVWTKRKDENVEGGVLERFPPDEYLRYIFHKLFTEPFFAADKSRQMRMSLLIMSWAVWRCQYKTHEQIVCQSQKRDDANFELLEERAWDIYQYQPSWLKPHADFTFCNLRFESMDSKMIAMAAGDNAGDQIRAKNPTCAILDEGGFYQGKFEECRTAAIACCKDIKCISTANPGQWADFIENDRIVA